MTTVADVLRQKDTRIITIRLSETVAMAVTLMKRENVHALVVKDVCRTEGNTVVGICSERDVARALADHGAGALDKTIAPRRCPDLITARRQFAAFFDQLTVLPQISTDAINRNFDNERVILQIAAAAGGDWPTRARKALERVRVSGGRGV